MSKKFAILESNEILNVVVASKKANVILENSQTAIELPTGSLAGIGWLYIDNVFVPPKPHPSWVLVNNEWESQVSPPQDQYLYNWDEELGEWTQGDEKPYKGWILTKSGELIPPSPMPNNGKVYYWDNNSQSWAHL
jgi:hypothetical protein